VPAAVTIRRTLARLDPEALAAAIGAWLTDRSPKPNRRRGVVAVDGKTLRCWRSDRAACSPARRPRRRSERLSQPLSR
jgi:hypothetical protein